MSIIGEAILTVTVEMLVEKLASEVIQLFARQEQIEAGLKKWKELLVTIKVVLDDAEEKQITKPLVKMWLGKLQNLAYDAEDMLDEFATEAFRRKLLLLEQADRRPTGTTSKFRMLIPACCTKLSPRSVKFDSMIAKQIEEITARFDEIAAEKDQLDLKEISGGFRYGRVQERPLSTTSLVDEDEVYGRKKDKEALVGLLRRDDLNSGRGFSVIPITGMGGLGKTTLAQLVFNDGRVKQHFPNFRAWAYVSEDFDAVGITKVILQAAVGSVDVNDLNLLQLQLENQLKDKKFLLVLDDMWTDNYDDWTNLCKPFKAGLPGSKIIVTTRNEDVSSMVTTPGAAYSLENLLRDDCLSIFVRHSLGRTDFSAHQYLSEIGEKIVDKCNGSPLAAKTLGGLLRGKYDPKDWEDVLTSKIWELGEDKSGIMRALRVSYYYLPSHVKRCFAHCSLLPKGYEFDERQIVLLWMAEGLLQHKTDEMEMEELGRKSFQVLHSRSFFQRSKIDASRFLMHDLIHDLACWASGEICSSMESAWDRKNQRRFSRNLRHLSYLSSRFDGIKRFEGIHEVEHLRTFLALPLSTRKELYVTNNLVFRVIPRLRRLRAVSLCRYWIFELPDNIGELKLLRYLDFSHSAIEVLPQSVSSLYNLQTLIVEHCYRLKKLFPDIGNLVNLRHLKNSHSNLLEEMPLRIGQLTSLRTLAKFAVGKGNCSGLRELRSLALLQEKLTISGLENVNDAEDAKEVQLTGKEKLEALSLKWGDSTTSSDSSEVVEIQTQTRVLEMLKPHYGLKELKVQGYGGTKFPAWLGQSSFENLAVLRFRNCNQCTSLPSVGHLPSLKNLVIKGMAKVKSVGLEFCGKYCSEPFRSLETLCFEDMQEWVEWISHAGTAGGDQEAAKGFPRLRELSIVSCSKLKGRLPQRFSSLERIVIRSCEQLLVSYTALPPLCELEIDGFSEVAWISHPVEAVVSDSSNSGLEESRAEFLPQEIMIRNQESLPDGLHKLGHITRISMVRSHLVSFAEGGLPTNLSELILFDCPYLTALPNGMYNLSSLQRLEIRDCPRIASIPEEVGFPPKVTTLQIKGPDICKLFFDLGFHNLTSVRELFIAGGREDDVAFQQLPTSLVELDIREFPRLESLSFVRILTSLERLQLSSCGNLKSFPENGLPPSVVYLTIYLCPHLEKRCKKDGGEYWHLVADIPFVKLNFKLVFDPREFS